MMRWLEKFRYKLKYRRTAQIGSLVVNNSYFFSFLKFCPTTGMNCYACPLAIGACPIGSLQHFAVVKQVPFFLLGFFTLIGGFFGRMACGWLCPIGWLQEMMHKIPLPKWKYRFATQWGIKFSPKVAFRCNPWTILKYVVLIVLVLLIPYITGEPWFSKLCFVGTLEAGVPLVIFDQEIRELISPLFFIKLGITTGLLLLFIFIRRPFCRFLCPLGAIYSLMNSFSYVRLTVDSGCNGCNACQKRCPVDLKVYENPNSAECIRCLECTTCSHVKLCVGKKKETNMEKGVEVYE